MNLLRKLLESYVTILLAAIVVGLTFPHIGLRAAPFATLFLQIIFFLSSLKLDIQSVKAEAAKTKQILLLNGYMLLVLPAIVYGLARFFVPQYALPLLILAAMPAGMTSMLLSEIIGGSVTFTLVVTMTTSLFAPVTVPIMLKLLAGASVAVPALQMFITLGKVIVIPFLLAQTVRFLLHERIKASYATFKPISITLLGLLILGVVSGQADAIRSNINGFLGALAILFIFFFLLHLAGYVSAAGLNKNDRLAATVCVTYMNFTLAIYLAGKFFPDPQVLIPVILSVFPWSIGIIPFKAIMKRKQ